jgi:vanillate O-demethylase ferredoxin subunit
MEGSFRVRLARSGVEFIIPEDQSIVEVLRAHGIDVPTSCEQGICGTCMTGVIEGTPDHRDLFMTDAEHAANDFITPCCSRAKTELIVLDL